MENAGQVTTPDGQPVEEVAYKVTKGGVTLYFQKDRVSYVYPKKEYQAAPNKPMKDSVLKTTGLYRMDMVLKGANPKVDLKGKGELESHTNYCKPGNTHLSIAHYKQVVYKNIYEGIDLVYKLKEGQ